MNRKSLTERSKILQCLIEGNSVRGTSRLMNCSKDTVLKLLVETGEACSAYQDKYLRNLSCKHVQVDEIWSYVYSKRKNTEHGDRDSAGDMWTWTAIDADTKLILCWAVGPRTAQMAKSYIAQVASRVNGRIQLTTDGFHSYPDAVESAFGSDIDYAALIKQYERLGSGDMGPQIYQGSLKSVLSGRPLNERITTSHVERQNLTMRMSIRRFARKTNAFSKKLENHCHALAIHFFHQNFIRVHGSLRTTPAMASGVTQKLWEMEDMVLLTEV